MPRRPLAAFSRTAGSNRSKAACSKRSSALGAMRSAFALGARIRVRLLRGTQKYRDASPALARLGIDVDAWPAPPAGLFVVEERGLYLRSRSPMTVAHEFGHALDCALGGGVYRSGIDPRVRAQFSRTRARSSRLTRPLESTSTSRSRCARSSASTIRFRRGRRRRAAASRASIARCTTTSATSFAPSFRAPRLEESWCPNARARPQLSRALSRRDGHRQFRDPLRCARDRRLADGLCE